MPRGVPRSGFRKTKNFVARQNGTMPQLMINNEPVPVKESRFTINQRFGFVDTMIRMLASGEQPSVVITGPGGLGKTHTVTMSLANAGFKDISHLEDFAVGEFMGKKTFRLVKGYSTAKGLYRTLYENKDGVVVFDDCDSVLRDPVSLNILKAALDSYSRRIISYNADIRDPDLPNTFEFKGRVVFISNMTANSLDQAIISRSMAVDLSMTTQQKVDRMWYLLEQDDFMPEYADEYKMDAMELIESLKDEVKDLSLRTLIQVTKFRKAGGKDWKSAAEYAMVG